MAYQLKLPEQLSDVHDVFHVSQLKKAKGTNHQVTASLPDQSFMWSIPEQILQRRSVDHGHHSVPQLLVKWSNVPESLATWEDADSLRQQFPHAAVWGQARFFHFYIF